MGGRGKTLVSREITNALSQHYKIVSLEHIDFSKGDTVDTIYIETELGSVLRIQVSEVD